VLSHERFGFAADRIVSAKDGRHPEGLRRSIDLNIILDSIIDIPSTQFDYEGHVTRGRDEHVYLRIRFHDGSGVEIHAR
jgi:hypothetical protein